MPNKNSFGYSREIAEEITKKCEKNPRVIAKLNYKGKGILKGMAVGIARKKKYRTNS